MTAERENLRITYLYIFIAYGVNCVKKNMAGIDPLDNRMCAAYSTSPPILNSMQEHLLYVHLCPSLFH